MALGINSSRIQWTKRCQSLLWETKAQSPFATLKRACCSKSSSPVAWTTRLWLDLQSLHEVPPQDFRRCFIIKGRSLSHVQFNQSAQRDDMEAWLPGFTHLYSSREKLNVSICQSLPGCSKSRWRVISSEGLSSFQMWQASFLVYTSSSLRVYFHLYSHYIFMNTKKIKNKNSEQRLAPFHKFEKTRTHKKKHKGGGNQRIW